MVIPDDYVEKLKQLNKAYREGNPLVSDFEYDTLVEELRGIDPGNPYLKKVEPEVFEKRKEIRHPFPMLSTEKAYTIKELERFVTRVQKFSKEIGVTDIQFRVTAKLDGLAGRDDGAVFATRGNGTIGYEISNSFQKGVVPVGGRGRGLGEIVISNTYFQDKLSSLFEHPRNMVVGIVTSDTLNESAVIALRDKAVRFVPYSELPFWEGSGEKLISDLDQITDEILGQIDYPVDGMVAEVTDVSLKEYMGHTNHHYRWQIAIKNRGETAVTRVNDITWQVGRTGSITPVLEVEPVKLSGATIRRVTAHNAGLIKKLEIGPGADIEIIRSGEVIPKLEKVIQTSQHVNLPDRCPDCDTELLWKNDFLKCMNSECPAKIIQKIIHFFKTLGNTDWFGKKTVEKLVSNGFNSLIAIYQMSEDDFYDLGFGPVQSNNLFEALQTSQTKPVEDFRFLASLGITNLGIGDSRKLLQVIPLSEVFSADRKQISSVHGFAEKTSKSIEIGFRNNKKTVDYLLNLGFNFEITELLSEKRVVTSPISGMGIVFSGKMTLGNRSEMQEEARKLGAIIQSAVTGKTDYLVCGEKVGASKLKKAEKLDVKTLLEQDYLTLIRQV